MDCFNTHYYRFNRKLLLIVGQWPYQRLAVRIKIWILYILVLVIAFGSMVASAIRQRVDFDMYIEYLSDCLTCLVSIIRYFLFAIKNEKATELLDNMKLNWQYLMDDNEYEIFAETAENGRVYVQRYLMIVCSVFITAWIIMFSPPLLNYMNLINGSNPHVLLYPAEYFFIDKEKYYYAILAHMYLTVVAEATTALAADTFFMIFMYHAIGMFKIVCHRLEHAFDDCNGTARNASGRTNVCERVATAVDYHRHAIRFCHTLSAMFDTANLICLLLVLTNITVALYWGIESKGKGFKAIIGIMLGVLQMIHLLTIEIPCQKIIDGSGSIAYKAYSSVWYMAPVQQQRLVLLTMQRGLKPSALMMGKFHPITLENYATEVKASFSYFTVLMSLK